ncbi:MAG: polyketide cyclase [Bacteroidetes bacterium]|nr:MAG: polyketide cyclase [Bacteroidota bacterium]
MSQIITIEIIVNAPIEKVWKYWTDPEYIIKWTFATEDWCCPKAKNDLKVGGKFNTRMEAKDGSFGFDFEGTYSEVVINKKIAYTIIDGRTVDIQFISDGNQTKIIEAFEAENENSLELQKNGWQAILGNFKKLVEN